MGIDMIGAVSPEYIRTGKSAEGFQKSPTAADFAEMIRKLAGPEMLWEEQAPEQLQENAPGDDSDARGVLASGWKQQRM